MNKIYINRNSLYSEVKKLVQDLFKFPRKRTRKNFFIKISLNVITQKNQV